MKASLFFLCATVVAFATERPNVVLVITDDQGYGDLGFTGNDAIKTPEIDKLINESVWLEDYHVAPTCSPTRCSLLTGHWTNRTGVWHTIMGRSMLRSNEVTLADHLHQAGYETGIFGKWHLGDVYPYRPEDRGFSHTYYHGAGGVGQTPDVWNNDYFDDRYYHNGQVVQSKGYCTDVFFEEAQKFIKKSIADKKPFFTYISTNAPHAPLLVPTEYSDLYKDVDGVDEKLAVYFGMISNVDENVGKLRSLLQELKVADNTIFIFTTDNGSTLGSRFYNAKMKGSKGSEYDGGHRVPFSIHWPAKGLTSHQPIKNLTHMVDIVPTLLEMTGVPNHQNVTFDGLSLCPLIDQKEQPESPKWADRVVFSDSQRVVDPIKWRKTSVMSGKWRLVNNKALYNVASDPGQSVNLIKQHPQIAQRLEAWYDREWAELEKTYSQTTELYVGADESPIVNLNSHDWIQPRTPAWNQSMVRGAHGAKLGEAFQGYWAIKVVKEQKYNLTVSRWPLETGFKITQKIPGEPMMPGHRSKPNYSIVSGVAIPVTKATLKLNGQVLEEKSVNDSDQSITFTTTLPAGSHKLSTFFTFNKGEKSGEVGTYYCRITPAE